MGELLHCDVRFVFPASVMYASAESRPLCLCPGDRLVEKMENLLLCCSLFESLCCHLPSQFYSELCKINFTVVCSMQRECIPESIPFYCSCSLKAVAQILRLVKYRGDLQPSLIIVVFNRQPPHNRGT